MNSKIKKPSTTTDVGHEEDSPNKQAASASGRLSGSVMAKMAKITAEVMADETNGAALKRGGFYAAKLALAKMAGSNGKKSTKTVPPAEK